ncbi:MAG: ComEC/Rec2 family competence protein [Anaerolineales bacterium]|nr:ComEC/Rec2 family competence protein [Anaerolineales bacterium]
MPVIKGITRLPLLVLSLSFLLGIVLAALIELDPSLWLGLSVITAVLWWLFTRYLLKRSTPQLEARSPYYRLALIMLVGLFLGGARYQSAQPSFDPQDVAWYNDRSQPVALVGVILKPPDVRESHVQVEIAAEEITVDYAAIPVKGRVLAYLSTSGTWEYGDRVRVWGMLQTPPTFEDFSYQQYLAHQHIYGYMPYTAAEVINKGNGNTLLAGLYAFKQRALSLAYTFLPDPEASLLAGIVLGIESGIPDEVDQAFKDTGTTHVIAISGFNITIVSGLFAILFGRLLGARRGAAAALAAITIYTVLVGADAAVVRAAIMGGLSLFAGQIGRRQHGFNSLAITAALMAVFNPLILRDIGFQLSFAATLGLIAYAQPWEEKLRSWLTGKFSAGTAHRLTGPISEYLLLTLAAQLVTFPLIVYHFGRLSLSSLPANVAILPAQPPVMIVGGLAVLVGSISPPLGQLLAYAVWPFLAYTIRMVEWFAGWQTGVRVVGGFSLWALVMFYLALFAITVYWQPMIEKLKSRVRPMILISAMLVAVFLIWQAVISAPDGHLHVIVMDVGNGEAVLIETPDGRFVLIGGGESTTRLADQLGRSLPLFHRKLDVLIVAGTRRDQLAALPAVIIRYPPDQVWWAGDVGASVPSSQLHTWVTHQQISLEEISAGQALDLGRGAEILVLQTSPQGAVLLIRWKNFRTLLPVGAERGELSSPDVLRFSQDLTAMLLANSGELERNPEGLIGIAHPQIVLLSVGAYNRSGHPNQELLALLQGYPLYRTDYHGSIELETDGQQMWVSVEHE